jgi:D-psicose/D-tagatose/L-ribulose 3-epimerase
MAAAIGLCSWIFGHRHHQRIAASAAALGCSGVELHGPFDQEPAAALRRLYADHGLAILSLTPENVDLAHQDWRERQRAVDSYERLLDAAAELGAPAITLHELVGRGSPQDSPPQEWERLRESCAQLALQAEQRGLDLLLEPLRPPLVSRIQRAADAVALIEAVGSPRLRIVLDTFHLDASETDPEGAIRCCAGRLGAVQLADRGRRGLGLGGIDLERYWRAFAAIGFAGPWILECAVGLVGPSPEEQPVDQEQLRLELEASLRWLRARLDSAEQG